MQGQGRQSSGGDALPGFNRPQTSTVWTGQYWSPVVGTAALADEEILERKYCAYSSLPHKQLPQ